VSADELVDFMAAGADERRTLYIGWKRRDMEANLSEDYRICGRCQVPFKTYEHDWNRSGLCSKACHHAHAKSSRKPG